MEMLGKEKCLLLRKIRQRINKDLDIDCEDYKCFFDYECSYRCPDYENELKLLQNEINKRRKGLKKIHVKGCYFLGDRFIVRYDVEREEYGRYVGHVPDKHILGEDITNDNIISNPDSLYR